MAYSKAAPFCFLQAVQVKSYDALVRDEVKSVIRSNRMTRWSLPLNLQLPIYVSHLANTADRPIPGPERIPCSRKG